MQLLRETARCFRKISKNTKNNFVSSIRCFFDPKSSLLVSCCHHTKRSCFSSFTSSVLNHLRKFPPVYRPQPLFQGCANPPDIFNLTYFSCTRLFLVMYRSYWQFVFHKGVDDQICVKSPVTLCHATQCYLCLQIWPAKVSGGY